MKKFLSLVLLIPFCFSGCGFENNATATSKKPETFAEFANVFGKYDIQGATPQITEALEESDSTLPPEVMLNKGAILLSELGRGQYDTEAMSWLPSSNGVYSFDMEIFDLDKMYTNFLVGVSALNPEELAFENIQEDTSRVNWEKGTGKRTVTFEWQGEQFTLEAEFEHDWFDFRVAEKLNKIIKKHGNGKQLFFTGDGYQECIVFYRDKKWADSFEAETGIKLV